MNLQDFEQNAPSHPKPTWPWHAFENFLIDSLADTSLWPKISIITPSFNQGQYLEETLRSVLLQDYPNLEYIVIDGGSTDNSVNIIRKYEPWLTYWQSKKDQGQSDAINQGIERATGDILAYLNSDDVYAPNALHTVAKYLANKTRALLVGSSVVTHGPNTFEGRLDDRKPNWDEIIYEARTFPQPSVFWTRDLWDVAGPITDDLYFVMDYELWVKMYPYVKQTYLITDILSYARTHPAQKSQESAIKALGNQRATVALREAHRRGESLFIWIAKAWLHMFKLAIRRRQPSLLRGTYFQHDVLRAALKR